MDAFKVVAVILLAVIVLALLGVVFTSPLVADHSNLFKQLDKKSGNSASGSIYRSPMSLVADVFDVFKPWSSTAPLISAQTLSLWAGGAIAVLVAIVALRYLIKVIGA